MSALLVHVRVVGLPVDVEQRASEHFEALRRELAFVHDADQPDTVPARLAALAADLSARYAGYSEGPSAVVAAAAAAGKATVDVDYHLPADAAEASTALAAMLDEVDAYCREGQLLTLVTPPEARAYRRWFLGEITEQIRDGRPPRPWGELSEHGAEPAGDARPGRALISTSGTGADTAATVVVDDDLDLELASRLRGDLVEIIERGATLVVVDMASCPFIDSAGLSLLITARSRLAERGGALHVVGAAGAVLRTFERAGVRDLLGLE